VTYTIKINFYFCIFLFAAVINPGNTSAQLSHTFDLDTAIVLAKQNSPEAVVALSRFKTSYWQYRSFRSNYLPLLSLDAVTPDITRALTRITLPDGSDAFVKRNLMSTSSTLSLSQQVVPTGGTISINSGLQRLDFLDPNDVFNRPLSHSYLSNPASIAFTQPVFGFNPMRWARQIEPLRYRLAKRQYAQDVEDISLKTVDLFFTFMQAQTALQIAKKNKANNDTIYNISQGRYNLGKLAENDLLQIRLNLLNADLAVQEAQLEVVTAASNFKSFMGIPIADTIKLKVADKYDSAEVNMQQAWLMAQQNSVRLMDDSRNIIEANRDIAQAKGNNRFKGNLFASYGLNRSSPELNQAYIRPEQQQQVHFGLSVPILDWGRAKGAIETAKAQQMVVEAITRKDKIDFEQEIYMRVTRYNIQKLQLKLSKTADEVADRRYFIAKERYMIGKIDITDLNIAQNERDAARRAFIESIRGYWQTYFGLRRATLYDFKNQKLLEEEVKAY
jgi:outer membrane protein